MAYDLGDASANALLGVQLATADRLTSSDPGTADRALWAAFLGNVTLGPELSVYVGHGSYVQANQENSGNSRTWYDGIAYGAPVPGLEPIANVPEPASVALFVLGMFGFGTLLCRRVR